MYCKTKKEKENARTEVIYKTCPDRDFPCETMHIETKEKGDWYTQLSQSKCWVLAILKTIVIFC